MICFIGGFDPISNNEFDFINQKLLKGEKIDLCLDESTNYLETKENRIKCLKKLFSKINIIDINSFNINVYNKVYKSADLNNFYNDLAEIETIEDFASFKEYKNNAINILEYKNVNQKIRNYLNLNLMYIDLRLDNVMDFNRKTHSLNVGDMAYELAVSNNVVDKHLLDQIKFAGTVHDIAKQVNNDEMELVLNKVNKSLLLEPKPVWHGFVGRYVLENNWLVTDNSILEAVFNHTVGKPNMSLTDKIVFCADKVSVERNYENVNDFRKNCIENIDIGFKKLLKNQYDVAVKKHGINSIGNQLLLTMDYYLK